MDPFSGISAMRNPRPFSQRATHSRAQILFPSKAEAAHPPPILGAEPANRGDRDTFRASRQENYPDHVLQIEGFRPGIAFLLRFYPDRRL